MNRNLIKTVELQFFNDEYSWGLTHAKTLNEGFDAFFNATGIFHDVFEHYQEHEHKYFKEQYAMNVGGEMFAMGAMWYYYNQLGVYNRLENRGTFSPSELMRDTTEDLILQAIQNGYCKFGDTLESCVPHQSPVYDEELETQIKILYDTVRKVKPNAYYRAERIFGRNYKKSVLFSKIANLHRYGFKQAELLVPDNGQNQKVLTEFLEFWDKFTKNNSAEDLSYYYNGITFRIYKSYSEISWSATLVGRGKTPNKRINVDSSTFVKILEY